MHTPRRRFAGEIVFAALLVVFSGFLLWTAYGISGFASLSSAGAFPMLAAAVLLLTGLVNLVQALKSRPTERQPGESALAKFAREVTPSVIVGFTLVIAAYMLLLDRLGFLVSSYLFLVASMRLLGGRRWGLYLVVAAVSLGAIYIVFETAFSVVLPAGTWWEGLRS
jgi:putative tricarboxylic transport membrane protein